MQCKDQLTLAMLMSGDTLLVFHHPHMKCHRRIVLAVRIVTLQTETNHHVVRY
ncbi:hypothetical protein D3C75_1188170 [compost metagenome]